MKRRIFYWMSYVVVLACFGLVRSGHADSGYSAAAGFLPLDIMGSPNALSADGTVIVGQFAPVGHELIILALNPGFGNVARRQTPALR